MSLSDVNDSSLFKWLTTSMNLLDKLFKFKASALIIKEMKQQLENEIPNINENELNRKFTNLQDTLEVEFCKRGDYSKSIFLYLQKKVRKTMKTNLAEYQKTFGVSSHMDRSEQRHRMYKILEKLRTTTLRGAKDEEDKMIGISFAYLGLVNGVYRFALQDCYRYELLANGQTVDPEYITKLEIHNIYCYYSDNNLPLDYFDGWNSTVRNAVGHSNFFYDEMKQKMIYVDEPNEPAKKQVSEYDFDEMADNYRKLLEVYYAVLIFDQMVLVSSSCFELERRYSQHNSK
jgi:hypothetical protein